jgi:superfamily II RNA helicase
MIEPMRRWVEGETAAVICTEYGLFEGNFIRTVMKMSNMLDEWLALATYCQHTDQIDKIMGVRNKMIRDIVISDSLYLHL